MRRGEELQHEAKWSGSDVERKDKKTREEEIKSRGVWREREREKERRKHNKALIEPREKLREVMKLCLLILLC